MKLNNHGFTLLETFIALAIFIVALTIVTSFIAKNYQASTFGQEQNEAIENARQGVETMIEEIRESGQSEEGGYLILENQEQSLKFYSDIDKDGILEQIHYSLDDTDFIKGVIEPTPQGEYLEDNKVETVLSQYVQNGIHPIFTYYNENYPVDMTDNPIPYEPSYIDDIKLIDIYLEVNVDPDRAPANYILRSKSQIRTLKDNL